MNRIHLVGVDGSNPLGFMAALGLLRVVPGAKLGFSEDGSFQAFVDGLDKSESELASLVAADAETAAKKSAPWRFTYTKPATKKHGPHEVADLKPPPDDFKNFLATCIEAWLAGKDEAASYAAAYGTDIAVDGNGNTKPTAFHFTAAQQTFLGAVEAIRASVTQEWVETSLFNGHGDRPGSNLRWDPTAERNWALMASDPTDDGTSVDAPLEWLAFRGLPLFPTFPINGGRRPRVITTAVTSRGDVTHFSWPLWTVGASLEAVRSLVRLDRNTLRSSRGAGVYAVCSSEIRRTSQGFGNFGPASVES